MSTLSQADYLRRKLENAKCCNPPVHKVGSRDSSEITQIRKYVAIGGSSIVGPKGRDASFTTGKNMGCSVKAGFGCTGNSSIVASAAEIIPFSPALFDGLSAWFDGQDSSTITIASSTVSRWADKSTNQNDFVQANPSFAPTLTTISGNRQALYINTADRGMLTESALDTSLCGSNSRSMFMVCIVPAASSFASVGYGPHTVALPRNTFGLNFARAASTAYSPYTYGTDITFSSSSSTICLIEGFYNGTAIYGYFNGTFISSQTIALNTSQTVLYFGNRPDSLGNINSTTCEILMYNTELTESKRQQIEGYLAWKWGFESILPTGHPYKLAHPATNI